jgi:hypothetical protein
MNDISSSEVLPAVLNTELSIDVFKWSLVLMGMEVKEYFSPLDGMLNIREFGTPCF